MPVAGSNFDGAAVPLNHRTAPECMTAHNDASNLVLPTADDTICVVSLSAAADVIGNPPEAIAVLNSPGPISAEDLRMIRLWFERHAEYYKMALDKDQQSLHDLGGTPRRAGPRADPLGRGDVEALVAACKVIRDHGADGARVEMRSSVPTIVDPVYGPCRPEGCQPGGATSTHDCVGHQGTAHAGQ